MTSKRIFVTELYNTKRFESHQYQIIWGGGSIDSYTRKQLGYKLLFQVPVQEIHNIVMCEEK